MEKVETTLQYWCTYCQQGLVHPTLTSTVEDYDSPAVKQALSEHLLEKHGIETNIPLYNALRLGEFGKPHFLVTGVKPFATGGHEPFVPIPVAEGFKDTPYVPMHPWEHIFAQAGVHRALKKGEFGEPEGKALPEKDEPEWAFFEAFPEGSFLRTEAPTVAEAEDKAWEAYQRHLNCPGHEFKPYRKGHEDHPYRNGAGFCQLCGRFESYVFTAEELGLHCTKCDKPTWYHFGSDGKPWCEDHWELDPTEAKEGHAKTLKYIQEIEKEMDEVTEDDISEALEALKELGKGKEV